MREFRAEVPGGTITAWQAGMRHFPWLERPGAMRQALRSITEAPGLRPG
jgi:hypothetical protein